MSTRAALLLTFAGPFLTSLYAQERGLRPMPMRTVNDLPAFFEQMSIQGVSTPKLPVLSKVVAVEDLGIRIPPPPASVDLAVSGLHDIQKEAAQSLAFLNKELAQLQTDQVTNLTILKANPNLASLGADSEFFKSLLRLSRDEETLRARRTFQKAGSQALADREASTERAIDLADLMWKTVILGNEKQVRESHQGVPRPSDPIETTWVRSSQRSWSTNSTNQMLSAYNHAWEEYARSITRFVDRVAENLKVPEKDLPPSTMLLVRLLKIQVFRIYSLQIQEQVQMWAQAAQVGAKPQVGPYPFDVENH